jgi:HAMP domain-containing protein/HPt (histidine-containing phosphotransfer) domain-containing protein
MLKIGIKSKLTLAMTFVAVTVGAGVGYLAYQVTSRELIKSETRGLQTTRQTLAANVEALLGKYRTSLSTQAGSPATREALKDFGTGYTSFPQQIGTALGLDAEAVRKANQLYYKESFGPLKLDGPPLVPPSAEAPSLLQYVFITANPAALGSKVRNNTPEEIEQMSPLEAAAKQAVTKSAYCAAAAKYHNFFEDLGRSLELDDILLISNSGDVVYSVAKRFEFGTKVADDSSALGGVYRDALALAAKKKSSDRIANSEIVLHRPGFDASTLFLSTPVLSEDGKADGVIVFAVNAGTFSRLLFGELTGSDNGTEAYLIGKDGRFRTESQYVKQLPAASRRDYYGGNSSMLGETAVMRLSLSPSQTGEAFASYLAKPYKNYLGEDVLGSAAKVGDGSLGLAIIVETKLAQLLSPVRKMGFTLLAVSGGAGILAFLLAYYTGRAVTRPLLALQQTAQKVAAGDLKQKAAVTTADEVGELATQFNSMLDEINHQHDQTRRIMNAVKEALFLIDRNHIVQPNYSKETESIFQKDFAGRSLVDFLRPYVTDKDLNTGKDYIGLLFEKKVKEKLIQQTNPLTEVELQMDDGRGGFKTQVLEFRFSRVIENDAVSYVMVTAMDVTSRVLLTRQIKEAEKKASAQVELLFGIMHVDPPALREFLDVSREHLEKVSFLLKDEQSRVAEGETPAQRTERYRSLLARIQRPVHLLKGNAAVLRIEFFEQRAHGFEDTIQRVAAKTKILGEDFVPVTNQLGELINVISTTVDVIGRLGAMNAEFTKSGRASADLLTKYSISDQISRFTSDLAESIGKKVAVRISGDIEKIVPTSQQMRVQEILTQLVRNAVVHGVEEPTVRAERRKLPVGTVQISARNIGDAYQLTVTDDGGGLDYEKIRKRAGELGYKGAETWGVQQLTEVLFAPGFSTAGQVTKDAGRGVGLDAVLDKVLAMGGALDVAQKEGIECSFIMTFDRNAVGTN